MWLLRRNPNNINCASTLTRKLNGISKRRGDFLAASKTHDLQLLAHARHTEDEVFDIAR